MSEDPAHRVDTLETVHHGIDRRFRAVNERRNSAKANLRHLGRRLHALGTKLEDDRGIRFNKPTTMRGPSRDYPHLLDDSDRVPWSQTQDAVQAFLDAENEYYRGEGELTLDQRHKIQQLRR